MNVIFTTGFKLFTCAQNFSNSTALPVFRINRYRIRISWQQIHQKTDMSDQIVQYVLMRSDLLSELNWPVGAVIAQACHACTAVTHLFYDDPHTKKYLEKLDEMHKIVLQVPNEETLSALATKLKENNIDYKLWIEQPENFPTCLVLKPYPKSDVSQYFKKLKLFKG